MVSEQFDSTARDSRWSSYCVYEAMAGDLIPQKVEPTKKKVIPIQSIVLDFKQELQNQRAILKQFLNELAVEMWGNAGTQSISEEEVSNTVSQKVTQQPKPGDSQHMEIESGGFTLDGEDAVHSADLSHVNLSVTTVNVNEKESVHEEVFYFTGKMKPVPDSKVVTVMIGEEGEEKKNRELFQREGPTEIISTIGGESINNRYTRHPDSGNLGFLPNPDPEPPDVYSPTAKVSFPMKSSTTLSSTTRGVGIQTVSSILIPSNTKKEAIDDHEARPNPCMGLETAQVSPDPFTSKHRRLLSPTSHQNLSVSRDQPLDHHGSDSWGNCKVGNGESRSRNVKWEESRISKKGEIRGRIDRVIPIPLLGTIESRLKEQSRSKKVQVSTNLLGENFRTQLSPLSYETYDAINPSPTTTDFRSIPILDLKLSSKLNSKPDLKLQYQLFQRVYATTLLFSCPLLSLIDTDQLFSTRTSLFWLSSDQLTQNCKNSRKWSSVKVVWQRDRHEGLRVEKVLGGGSPDHSKQETKLFYLFQIVRLGRVENIYMQGGKLNESVNWQNYSRDRLGGKPWTSTRILKQKGDRKLNCKHLNSIQSRIMKYFVWKCINGWPGLMEFIRMVVKVKLAAKLLGFKMAQDEEDDLLWRSADYSKHETKLLECFRVAELGLKAENTHNQEYVVENMSAISAEILVTLAIALQRKCDIMASHSRIGNDIMWSFCEGEMEQDWKDWTSMAAGLGELAIGQQQFLYFFYPP